MGKEKALDEIRLENIVEAYAQIIVLSSPIHGQATANAYLRIRLKNGQRRFYSFAGIMEGARALDLKLDATTMANRYDRSKMNMIHRSLRQLMKLKN